MLASLERRENRVQWDKNDQNSQNQYFKQEHMHFQYIS